MPNKYLLIILILSLTGCIITPQPVKQSYLRPAPRNILPAEFGLQADILTNDLKKATDREIQADLHLQLARLYTDANNPHLDYGKALLHFKAFARLAPKNAPHPEIQNWLTVLEYNQRTERLNKDCSAKLQEMQEEERIATSLQKRIDELEKKLIAAQRKNKNIVARNDDLKKTIEKLKFLDLKLENKRKSYR